MSATRAVETTLEQEKLIDQTLSEMISGTLSFEQSPEQIRSAVSTRSRIAEQMARRQNTGTRRLENVSTEEYMVIRDGLNKMPTSALGAFSQSQVRTLVTHIDEVVGQPQIQTAGRTGG